MTKAVVLSIKNHVKRAEPAKRRKRAGADKSVSTTATASVPAERPRARVKSSAFTTHTAPPSRRAMD